MQQERRERADSVQTRRRLERDYRIRNGLEPSLGTKGRNLMEAFVTGLALKGLWDAFRR